MYFTPAFFFGDRIGIFHKLVGDILDRLETEQDNLRAAMEWALDTDPLLAWRMRLDVASITRIGRRGTVPFLSAFNETAHLR